MVSLKVPLEHFLQYLEKEKRVHRAVGVDYDLSIFAGAQKAKSRTARAVKDAKLMEEWVGSDISKEMVLKSTQGPRCIHERKDDPGFFTKLVHQLPNLFLSVRIFLNCYPGRCGGWELTSREEMAQQLAEEDLGNVLKFARHKNSADIRSLEEMGT